jgi:hypothetical protein
MNNEQFWGVWRTSCRAALTCMLISSAACHSPVPADPQISSSHVNDVIDASEKILLTSVHAAEVACLSNSTTQESNSLKLKFQDIVGQLTSAASVEQKSEVLRGAQRDLPASAQLIENDKIRNCINDKIRPLFAMVVETFQNATPNSGPPNPIEFRFDFIRGSSRDPKLYTEYVRADLQTPFGAKSWRLGLQDPDGSKYYEQYIAYPKEGEPIVGTIVAERTPDARILSTPPIITDVCFQRPGKLPTARTIDYDLFECTEGKACRPSSHTTGWLQACATQRSAQSGSSEFSFIRPAIAAGFQQFGTTATVAPYWSVPSIEALSQRNFEGVGYTVFTLDTDAFRQQDIVRVEVDLHVNGVPVREDGLPAELRPIANNPQARLIHRFALQTLDFEGAHEGCDAIDVALRPVFAGGRKGEAQLSTLTYVALRDVAPRTQRLGNSELKWSASYITPQREWRNIAEVHSYIYSTQDPVSQKREVEQALKDKRWLDDQGLFYKGLKVVGVIRPPRTVQSNGTAAFGLGTGLIQENGQVRFTFSDGDARELAAFMIMQRLRGSDAARIIQREPYIFQAIGGSYTAGGVCEVPMRSTLPARGAVHPQ